jgi:hypothetical protein
VLVGNLLDAARRSRRPSRLLGCWNGLDDDWSVVEQAVKASSSVAPKAAILMVSSSSSGVQGELPPWPDADIGAIASAA